IGSGDLLILFRRPRPLPVRIPYVRLVVIIHSDGHFLPIDGPDAPLFGFCLAAADYIQVIWTYFAMFVTGAVSQQQIGTPDDDDHSADADACFLVNDDAPYIRRF